MAATTADTVLPPIVFLTALVGGFIIIVAAMNPTIESNLQANRTPGSLGGIPDYLHTLFPNSTENYLNPAPYSVSASDRIVNFPAGVVGHRIDFTSDASSEKHHPVHMWAVGKELGDISGDRHELYFQQDGGWFGIQDYGCMLTIDAFATRNFTLNGETHCVYQGAVKLRHTYDVFITNGPHTNASGDFLTESVSIALDYLNYDFNVTVGYSNNGTGTNIWAIVAGLFTFNLPGVPFYITALIMGPIYVTIAVTAYILVRSALPM
jgi:hypothetical protein